MIPGYVSFRLAGLANSQFLALRQETEMVVSPSQWRKSMASIVATALTVFAIILVMSGVTDQRDHGVTGPSEESLNALPVAVDELADMQMVSSDKGSMSTTKAPKKPHVFFILVDDQGHNDIGYNSIDLEWATPFIDSLANSGVILERYYTMHLCTPSRAALMTGHYPHRIGMQHGVIQAAAPWGLPLKSTIMPQYLDKLGYESHMIGKWHLGFHNESFIPTSRGFETYLGYLGDQEHYKTHKYDRTVDNRYFYDFIETKPDNTFRLLATSDEFANTSSAVAFVKRAHYLLDSYEEREAKRPLFLYLAFQNVHGPLDVIEDDYFVGTGFLKSIQEVPDLQRRKFSRLTAQLDLSVEVRIVFPIGSAYVPLSPRSSLCYRPSTIASAIPLASKTLCSSTPPTTVDAKTLEATILHCAGANISCTKEE